MKWPEHCFLEILDFVKENRNNTVDHGESVATSVISYSKLEEVEGRMYVYNGYINLERDVWLHFYFSHKRSYISIDKETSFTEDDIARYQYFMLLYGEALFAKYSIDNFISNLHA